MRLYNALYLWRPERRRNVVHAANLNSRPVGSGREIGNSADAIQSHRQTVVKKRSAFARFFKTISKQFAYSGNQTASTAASGKLNPSPTHPARRAYEPKTATHVKHSVGPKLESSPIVAESEIGNSADRVQSRRQTVVKKRSAIARLFTTLKKQFAYGGNQTAAVASGRKLNPSPAHAAPRAYEPKTATHVKHSVGPKLDSRPIGAESEIGNSADRIQSHRQTVVKKRSAIARFFKKQFLGGNQTPATAASGRKNPIPAHPARGAYEPKTATDIKRSVGPKLDTRPIGHEREIGNSTDRLQSHRQTVVKKRSAIARFFKAISKHFAFRGILNPIPARPTPRVGIDRSVGPNGQAAGKAGLRVTLFVSVCFGLLILCGVIIALLFLQIKDMKSEMALRNQHLAALEAHLNKVEKNAQEQIGKESRILEAPQRRVPITLSNDDMKAIRAFIKVLPSRPGTQQKFHVGDEIANFRSAPVPEPLVNQLPRLRGAKFLVDENGAIIIIGDGSNRADAVIEPQ